MSHPFGDLLRQYCARKRGLSQTRLAHMIGYDQAVLVRMSQGKKDLTGPSGRARVIAILSALRDEGVLKTLDEANALMKAAGMPPLFDGQPMEAALLQALYGAFAGVANSTLVSVAALATTSGPATHFTPPAPLTPLVGREREVAAVTRLLATARLVTLTGAGGSGKTRLSQEVAAHLEQKLDHGACFISLAPIQPAGDVVPALVRALGVPDRSDVPALQTLQQFLARKSALLVLDNFEHVLDAAPVVADLLLAAPGVRVLATSREPLRVTGEHVYPVEPLEVGAAVELFAQRARAVKPSFGLAGVEEIVAAICRRVDCLPLAIELAAATVRQYSPKALLARLNTQGLEGLARLDALAGGPRDAPARHRTLRTAIAWSYDLLNADEQRLLRVLGIFAGGAEVDQIKSIRGSVETHTLTSTLQSLMDKNLTMAEEAADGAVRYSLLELIREFALDQLAERGELAATRRAHAEAYCLLAEESEPHIHDREQRYWVPRLEREHNNIRAALSWSLTPEGDPQLGLRLASRTWLFWWVGHLIEGGTWLSKLLDAAGPGAPALTRGRALLGCACLPLSGGLIHSDFAASLEQAKAMLEDAMRLLCAVGDDEGVVFAVYRLGVRHPDDERVRKLAQEGMTPERWQGNRLGLEWAAFLYVHNINWLSAFQRCYDMIDSVIRSAEERGDLQTLALATIDKCHYELYRGDLLRARALAEQALSTARVIGANMEEMMALNRLAEISELMGDLDSALRCVEERLDLADKYGWPPYAKAEPLAIWGKVARDRGDYTAAHSYFVESLRSWEPDYQWWALEGLSCVASTQGRYVRAARLLGAAEADREKRNDPWWKKDKHDLAQYIAQARAGLGDEVYEAAYAEGRGMNLEQAKAYALAE